MADRERNRHFDREQRWQGSGYWVDDEEFVEGRREQHQGDRTRPYDEQDARRYREESLDEHYRWQDPRYRRAGRGDWDTRYSEGRDAGQERAWEHASRNWQEGEEYGPAEPGNWHNRGDAGMEQSGSWRRQGERRGRPGRRGGWHDWPERQEPNQRQDDDWQNLQRGNWQDRQGSDWQNRQRGDWDNRQQDDWQERSRRERWFARDNSERDWVPESDFYANRGWARPSSDERERDWGYRGGGSYGRERRLEIDFNRDRDQPDWRSEREFERGVDAEHNLSQRRSQPWDASDQRPWDEGQAMSRERGFYQGDRPRRGAAYGPHRGAGPKGYQRSDERIKEEVCERLTWHGQIDASNIEIDVQDGEVTLRGQVDHKYEKRMAEDVIESISGVKDIQNHLRIAK